MNGFSTRRSHCLTSLVFDQLLAEEREGLDEARAHLQTCDSCQKHLESLKQEQEAALDPESVAAGVDAIIQAYQTQKYKKNVVSFSKYKIAISGGVALAAAASLALVLSLVEIQDPAGDETGRGSVTVSDGIRLKGSTVFQLFVVSQGHAQLLSSKDLVKAGDMLSFRVTVNRPRHVSVAGIGEKGSAYYLDHQHTAPWKVEPGKSFQLPVSAQVDAQPGNERVFAFFCEHPISSSAALNSIEKLYPMDNGDHRNVDIERLPSPPGCSARSFLLRRSQ